MPTIENLNVGLTMQTSGFTAGISGAVSGLAKFGLAVQGAKSLLAGLETAFTAITDQLRKIDDIGDLAGNLGITTEELSRLQYAAKQTDSNVEALNMALKRMAASRPGQSFAQSLDEVQNSLTRAETAREIFGRGWVEISSLLRLTKEEVAALGDESDALGNTISGSMADAANETVNSIQKMEDAWEGFKNSLAGLAAPYITEGIKILLQGLLGLEFAFKSLDNIVIQHSLENPFGKILYKRPPQDLAFEFINRGLELEKLFQPKERPPRRDVNEDGNENDDDRDLKKVVRDLKKEAFKALADETVDALLKEENLRKDTLTALRKEAFKALGEANDIGVGQSVGAASRFTSEGFSAVQRGRAQAEHLVVAKKQLAEAEKTRRALERLFAEDRDEGAAL